MKKIDYQETSSDLQARIDIHQKYGSRDIDEWMLQLLNPSKGSKILDVGCGAGKQCFAYHQFLDGHAEITGGDLSVELLDKARAENTRRGSRIEFTELNFNKGFPFQDNRFDLVSCCFAIYYAEDASTTIGEMHRVLVPGGRLFTTGPMPENKRLFYDIIREATERPIPPMPGSSRYGSEILESIRTAFPTVEVHTFENPLEFHEVEPFMNYTRASLSEDRKLWAGFFRGGDDFERTLERIARAAQMRLERDGALVMTKVVGGFLAQK